MYTLDMPKKAVETVAKLRKQQRITQTEMGRRLGMTRAWVARLEKSDDPSIYDLRRYLGALGGSLEIRITWPAVTP